MRVLMSMVVPYPSDAENLKLCGMSGRRAIRFSAHGELARKRYLVKPLCTSTEAEMNLEALGWNERRRQQFSAYAALGLSSFAPVAYPHTPSAKAERPSCWPA
jgi:hypothetical protein